MALTDFDTPLSNVEAILQNALGAENEVVPQSRVEELLDRLDKALEDIDIGTSSNVITRIEANKIKFISKEGGGQ